MTRHLHLTYGTNGFQTKKKSDQSLGLNTIRTNALVCTVILLSADVLIMIHQLQNKCMSYHVRPTFKVGGHYVWSLS